MRTLAFLVVGSCVLMVPLNAWRQDWLSVILYVAVALSVVGSFPKKTV